MILVINLKTYPSGIGKNAEKLASFCREAAGKTGSRIFLAPQIADINMTSGIIQTLSQHVDYFPAERATGFITPEEIKANGAVGSIINHSEHKLSLEEIKKTIARCKKLGLKTFVCAANLKEVKSIIPLKPYAIAYEVPELIATGKSISKVKASSVRKFSQLLKGKGIIGLCGAGISSGEDVKESLKLGCDGVLAASVVTKSKNPEKIIMELASAGNYKKAK